MNRRPSDFDARLSAWLEEGPSTGPESLLSSTFARARSTRQDRVRLQRLFQPTRFQAMNTMLKVAVVAAFALAVGVAILPRGPERAAAPAPSPSPSPVLLEGYAPALAAGTYQQSLGTGTWTVTVPEGWEEFYGILWADVDGVSSPPTAGGPGEVALGWWDVGNVFADPCHWQDSLADPPVGPTVDDLATAFVEQVGRDGSATDVIFAGYPAKRVELSTPADLDVATCDMGVYREFLNPGEHISVVPDATYPDVSGQNTVLYILDIDGERSMLRTWHRPDASTHHVAEMEAMLASSVIDPPEPMPLHRASLNGQGSLDPGTYTMTPFGGAEWAPCGPAPEPCPEAAVDDAIRFTFTVPDGWAPAPLGNDIWLADQANSGPAGAGLLMGRGGWVYSDPCVGEDPDVPVGPTVDDFVDALVDHPMLDPTEPVDVTVGGYPGKYLTLTSPADSSGCQYFQAWAPTFYAQGLSNLWHIWAIDVDGVRVVLHGSEFPETAPERSADLRAIVDSMEIDVEPAPDPSPSSSPAV